MTGSDDEFYAYLLETFKEDAEDLLCGISSGLIGIEQAGDIPAELIEDVFRKTHSLKGASRAVNLREIEAVSLNLENIFSLMKQGDYHPDAEAFDLLHQAVKTIRSSLTGSGGQALSLYEVANLLRGLHIRNDPVDPAEPGRIIPGSMRKDDISAYPDPALEIRPHDMSGVLTPSEDFGSIPAPEEDLACMSSGGDGDSSSLSEFLYGRDEKSNEMIKDIGTIRISAKKFERLISESDDLLTTRLFITHRMMELEQMMGRFSLWRWNHSLVFNDLHLIREIFFGVEKVDLPPEVLLLLERIVDFLKYDREFVTNLQHDLGAHIRATDTDRSALESSTSEISALIHDAVLVPISGLLHSFTGVVREHSRSLGKEVELRIEGDELEMDRRILDALRVPLIHLINNSIDHGIEYPDIRISRSKPPRGILSIRIIPHSGSKVEIELSDDGAGIDCTRLRETAVRQGLASRQEVDGLSDSDAIWLIFKSGLSTSLTITDLSGRGLGLAIVEDTITRLGGDVRVSSDPGKGARFSLILPVRLATFRGAVVRAGNHTYVIPVQQVRKVIRIDPEAVFRQMNNDVIRVDDETIRIIPLIKALGMVEPRSATRYSNQMPVVIISYGAGQFACIVDEVIRVQEIVVRPLGAQLKRVRRIMGAVILGDGRAALVLDPIELIHTALHVSSHNRSYPESKGRIWKILVADDSVTSRTLIQRTLERAGYDVQIAVDGMDAFSKLKENSYDLLVSDVDMPRMSGFTLTEKIRADDRLATMGVILVTALSSSEDRLHGQAVGADAYIIKSSFERGNLLKVVQKMLPSALS
ncbi:MAG TPA: chemotaxis protein CheW [Methanospirillum sp.]|nr:chemotaxis protein CheW [Methanospirillum sp.]